jgi:hypothetical protein
MEKAKRFSLELPNTAEGKGTNLVNQHQGWGPSFGLQ